MKPFFSIVIPTLNEEKYLPKLLNDLSKQTEKGFEVIIADGYSKDNTKKIAEEFKKKLSIKFYQTKLKNVAAQRNYGAKRSIGEYIVFFDADSRINSSFLNKVNKSIINKKGLLFIPYFSPDREYRQYKPVFDFINNLIELTQNFSNRFSLGGVMIVEKGFFGLIKGFDDSLYISEDHELIQRAGNWGVNAKFIKNVQVVFSLRRMKKEGEIKFLYKYILSFTRRLISGEIKDKIFDYQMGGQIYNEKEAKVKKEEFFKGYLKQIKKLFNKLIED